MDLLVRAQASPQGHRALLQQSSASRQGKLCSSAAESAAAAAASTDAPCAAALGAEVSPFRDFFKSLPAGYDISNLGEAGMAPPQMQLAGHAGQFGPGVLQPSNRTSDAAQVAATFASLEPLVLPIAHRSGGGAAGDEVAPRPGIIAGLSPLGSPTPMEGSAPSPASLLPALSSPGPLGSPVNLPPPAPAGKKAKSTRRL
eukprot:TRINITY_DN50522_c0_g1_i1.p1 TRINITY_DN50522_c0_g1~~TRINITY_DN50522_c0_g1_i1.p1  ORF type:complete len:200 (+),score=40.39 TRINITY_DN50522_c0_g1_i1:38-637(+)